MEAKLDAIAAQLVAILELFKSIESLRGDAQNTCAEVLQFGIAFQAHGNRRVQLGSALVAFQGSRATSSISATSSLAGGAPGKKRAWDTSETHDASHLSTPQPGIPRPSWVDISKQQDELDGVTSSEHQTPSARARQFKFRSQLRLSGWSTNAKKAERVFMAEKFMAAAKAQGVIIQPSYHFALNPRGKDAHLQFTCPHEATTFLRQCTAQGRDIPPIEGVQLTLHPVPTGRAYIFNRAVGKALRAIRIAANIASHDKDTVQATWHSGMIWHGQFKVARVTVETQRPDDTCFTLKVDETACKSTGVPHESLKQDFQNLARFDTIFLTWTTMVHNVTSVTSPFWRSYGLMGLRCGFLNTHPFRG